MNGSVRLGATAQDVGSVADPMKVEVVGTALVAVVSTVGQFELGDVPTGDVKLHFFGAGVDAYVTVSEVGTGETVTISVTVVGTTAAIDSQARQGCQGSSEEQIDGKIESLPPDQSAGTLVVSGRTIHTDGSTVFKESGAPRSFIDLTVGLRVHVTGRTTGGVFVATLIDIQTVQTTTPVDVSGTVAGLSGSELSFQFTISSQVIKGDNQTQFVSDSGKQLSFTDLKNGLTISVKGQQQTGAVYAVKVYMKVEPPPSVDFEGTGYVSNVTGSCPTISFTLGLVSVTSSSSVTVTTTASTNFDGGCANVKSGAKVSVKGTKGTDGTVTASQVWIGTPAPSPIDFEATGTVSDQGGTCPVIGFTLTVTGTTSSTYRIYTTSSTPFAGGTCADVKNGAKVSVKGTKASDSWVVTPSQVTIVTPAPTDSPFEGTGTISNVGGTCPVIGFNLAVTGTSSSYRIYTTSSTSFTGGSCADMKNGATVTVKGTKAADTSVVTPTQITIVTPAPSAIPFDATGTVSDLALSCPSIGFTLTVTGTTSSTFRVYTSSSTPFAGGTCADVKNGAKVSVKGTKAPDNWVVTPSQVTIVTPAPAPTPFEVTGSVSSLGGTCPSVGFTLTATGTTSSTFRVYTSSSTTFTGVTCTGMTNGLTVYVKGTKNDAGAITASNVEKK